MDFAQIFRIASGGQAINVLQGTSALFSPYGILALFEFSGDILLAEPMDNPGINITNTANRLEFPPPMVDDKFFEGRFQFDGNQ